MIGVLAGLGAAAAGGLAWGWFEAGWVRLRELACPVDGLPPGLDGLRVAHLSDFHLGVFGRGAGAVERAVAWTSERRPDLVCVTGDLLSRPSGEPLLRRLVDRLPQCYAVLGNHDYAHARDPFATARPLRELSPATLLRDEARTIEVRGLRVQVVGIDPISYLSRRVDVAALADPDADLRILLSHYPRVVERYDASAYGLVLSGHLHDGQIAIPYGLGKLRLAHLDFPYPSGIYRRGATTLHVSPGLGTTFVPFRFAARPEATELVLRTERLLQGT